MDASEGGVRFPNGDYGLVSESLVLLVGTVFLYA